MKRLLSSKAGFVFLVISVLLAGVFAFSTQRTVYAMKWRIQINVCGGAIDFVYWPGGARVLFDVAAPGSFRIDTIIPTTIPDLEHAIRPFTYQDNDIRGVRGVMVPVWMLFTPSALASWFFYRRARRKRLIGRCSKCEYDLTGNVSGVCPECGERI